MYQIDKKRKVRQYEAIPEQPMGKLLQVDWGETKQKTKSNKEIKLYFIAFVLAHSRMKYMELYFAIGLWFLRNVSEVKFSILWE